MKGAYISLECQVELPASRFKAILPDTYQDKAEEN